MQPHRVLHFNRHRCCSRDTKPSVGERVAIQDVANDFPASTVRETIGEHHRCPAHDPAILKPAIGIVSRELDIGRVRALGMTRELRHPAIGVVLPRERVAEGIGQGVERTPLESIVVANRVGAHDERGTPNLTDLVIEERS